jgi:restriction system protein
MKLKMAKNSLFAILLRSPWWVSMLIVALISLLSGALLPADYVPFGVMGAFPFLGIGMVAAWRQMRAPSPARVAEALLKAGTLSWRDFSSLLEAAYVRQGYTVTRINSPAADFSLSKDGQIRLISAKRWKAATHGVEALRDLVALRDAREAQHCSYLSLNPLTDNARHFAQAQGVHLTTDAELAGLMDHV